MKVIKEDAKKVNTKDSNGKENGWLLEMFKGPENKTEVYLTSVIPGSFKGFHLHRIRASRYVCLRGKVRIITYEFRNGYWNKPETPHWDRSENTLDSSFPQRLLISPEVAVGIENIGDTEAWLINYPFPAYDPAQKDEQVEYTLEELEKGIIK
jgi:dTDP-4-dehydrorhamnose 3,5-epimerase-like enzyme